ncbi:hypothetical protein [Prosthecodimorpha staleyi]|uniref:Uncharacterized protein n=1 Tax=Prosthecodimorpha staleyi TaxID=2840188 RepID=A0A947DDA5_9HYPH|nr:hypothetical protein [Prosthecodimorpha staleyi]MBT9293324.1 hypothetical protein [Prosthecodimorpha staleyi]
MIIVTDHAVLRYLERVHGHDIEAVRVEIAGLVGEACAAADRAGLPADRIVVAATCRLAVHNGYVVTVKPRRRG